LKQELKGNSWDTTEGYDTNNDAKVSLPSIPLPHVIDSLVELSGIELEPLCGRLSPQAKS
jgi:hypothetical protein